MIGRKGVLAKSSLLYHYHPSAAVGGIINMLGLTPTQNPRIGTANFQFTVPGSPIVTHHRSFQFTVPGSPIVTHHLSFQPARPSIINTPPFYTGPSAKIRDLVVRAEGNSSKDNGDSPEIKGNNGDNEKESGVDGELKSEENRRPRFNLNWTELLLDPDPENVAAVGLTGLLTWASIQVLWQLLIVSGAIVVAALKYSLIAALLLFILITFL